MDDRPLGYLMRKLNWPAGTPFEIGQQLDDVVPLIRIGDSVVLSSTDAGPVDCRSDASNAVGQIVHSQLGKLRRVGTLICTHCEQKTGKRRVLAGAYASGTHGIWVQVHTDRVPSEYRGDNRPMGEHMIPLHTGHPVDPALPISGHPEFTTCAGCQRIWLILVDGRSMRLGELGRPARSATIHP